MASAPLCYPCLFASIEMEAKATKGFLSPLNYCINYFCPKTKNSPADNNHIFKKMFILYINEDMNE